ncbi:hypothetical protein pb186bvf_005546 [Paramecium bursaria]
MTNELSGWEQCELSEAVNCKYNAIQEFVRRQSQSRSYSLCRKRGSVPIKSNLISDKENKPLFRRKINKSENQTCQIEQLKKALEFLQGSGQQMRYESHLHLDKHKPEIDLGDLEDRKQKLRLQLQNQRVTKSLQEQNQNIDIPKISNITTFKFPKFVIQQQPKSKRIHHFKTELNTCVREKNENQPQKISRILSNRQIMANNFIVNTQQTPKTLQVNLHNKSYEISCMISEFKRKKYKHQIRK